MLKLVLNLVLVLGCCLALPSSSGPQMMKNYHEAVGIPQAERIKVEETASPKTNKADSRIVGGRYAALGQFPHIGGLIIDLTNRTSVCASSLVSNTKLVTAASCWWDGTHQGVTMVVVLGSLTLFYGGTRIRTDAVVMHQDWNPTAIQRNLLNNIAVITITSVAYSNTIRNIALPWIDNNYEGWMMESAGYGRQSDRHWGIYATQRLHYTNLRVINTDDCFRMWGSNVDGNAICTDGSELRSTCSGDAGAPLQVQSGGQDLLIGVASFGWAHGCETGWPAAFVRVYAFEPWIRSQM